jgi:hypothetical protein
LRARWDDPGYAVGDVIARAMGYLDRGTPIAAISAADRVEPVARDLLADIAVVLGGSAGTIGDVHSCAPGQCWPTRGGGADRARAELLGRSRVRG